MVADFISVRVQHTQSGNRSSGILRIDLVSIYGGPTVLSPVLGMDDRAMTRETKISFNLELSGRERQNEQY